MRRRKLFWQLYMANVIVILLALLTFFLLTTYSFKNILLDQVAEDLRVRATIMRGELLRTWLDGDTIRMRELCADMSREAATRVTLIDDAGTVIADSWHDEAVMENHRARPEVRDALAGTYTTAVRYSNTLHMNSMYAAIPLRSDGRVIGVLRTAVPLGLVEESIAGLQWQIMFGGVLIAIGAMLVSYFVARRLKRPLDGLKDGARRFAAGDLEYRMPVPESEELRGLADVMNDMAAQLRQRLMQITRQHGLQDAVLTSMREGVLTFDMDERLIDVNRSAARLLRIHPEKSRGKHIEEVVRNIGVQRFVDRTIHSGETTEGSVTLVDDRERFIQLHGSLLRDAQGHPMGIVVVMNDYTELRKLENVRREFVANVSHELKTPITSIKGYVETLIDGALDSRDNALRFLGIVSRQADRLNAIIEDLLSLSRIEQESDQELISMEPSAVYDVLSSAVQACQVAVEEKRMQLSLDCARDLRAVMNAALLEQAVINLINNAIKYSEEGTRVFVAAVETEARHIRIMVRDEGIGIDAEHLPRLFERFYRIDKARSRRLGGTGLGLAIVKHIAQAHGGTVEVHSAPGKGSTFSLIFPATRSERGPAAILPGVPASAQRAPDVTSESGA
ncbi:MAG: ATP-binding protein [Bacteroidota bacterium]|jgi:two-component system phosphate regulon sensor histidine kinase PhoR|nr:ATP-binding protein [Bacteroidota bacterium]